MDEVMEANKESLYGHHRSQRCHESWCALLGRAIQTQRILLQPKNA